MPKLSIIIATRDRNELLEKTLLSLTTQSFKNNFDVLVCDDGGNSNTDKLINKFRNDLNIKYYFCNDKNDYCWAQAKNIGARKSSSKILMFMDDDIIMYPNTVEQMYKWFARSPFRKNRYFVTPHERLYIDKNVPSEYITSDIEKLNDFGIGNNYKNNLTLGCCGMISKDVFNKVGCYDEILFCGLQLGDIDIHQRLRAFLKIKNKVLPIMVFHLDNNSFRDKRNLKAINRKIIARQLIAEKMHTMGFKFIKYDSDFRKDFNNFSKEHYKDLLENKEMRDQISHTLRNRLKLYDHPDNCLDIKINHDQS